MIADDNKVNLLSPGRPDYTGPVEGVFAFIHHEILAEWSPNILERVMVISRDKPKYERATRLWCMAYLDPKGQPWEAAILTLSAINREYQLNASGKTPSPTTTEEEWLWIGQRWSLAQQKLWAQLHCHRQSIEAQVRALVPDLFWDGKRLALSDYRKK